MLDEFFVEPPAGFPDHPHRGIETVTYVLKGSFEHEDFTGRKGRIDAGDIQWMRAGKAIMHAEMPVLGGAAVNHGLQLWVNLPRREKMSEPLYQEHTSAVLPWADLPNAAGRVKIIAGEPYGVKAKVDTVTPIIYQHYFVEAGKTVEIPVPSSFTAFLYVLNGQARFGATKDLGEAHTTLVANNGGDTILVETDPDVKCDFVLVAGEPLGEPVVQHGPFVMTTREEIMETMKDFHEARNGFENAHNWRSKIGNSSENGRVRIPCRKFLQHVQKLAEVQITQRMATPYITVNPSAASDPTLAHIVPKIDESVVQFVHAASDHVWVEGPSYLPHADAFVFSDIPPSQQWAVDRSSGSKRLARYGTGLCNGTFLSSRLSAIAELDGKKYGRERKWDVILCCEHSGRRISAVTYETIIDSKEGKKEDHIEAVEKKVLVDNYQGKPFNSPNDVIELPDGSVIFTDPTYGCYPSTIEGHGLFPAQPETAVYRFHLSDPQGTIEKIATGMSMPNGLTFLAPSTLLVADSGAGLPLYLDPKRWDFSRPHHVKAFTLPVQIPVGTKADGTLGTYSGKWGDVTSTARVVVNAQKGIPDGIRLDAAGRLWVTTDNGIEVYAPVLPSATEPPAHLFTLNFPVVTANFCFGGPGMDVLCVCNNHDVWLVKGLGIKGLP
ncbi:hypothetical protein HDU93_009021, partial [Gonapodya sp. JEL0774]